MERVLDYYKEKKRKVQNKRISESFKNYTLSFEFDHKGINIDINDILFVKSLVNPRDKLEIQIKIDDGYPYTFYSLEENEETFATLDDINDAVEEDSKIEIMFSISKRSIGNTLSIYSLKEFKAFIFKLNLKYLLNNFNEFLSSNNLNKLEIQSCSEKKLYYQSPWLSIGTIKALESITESYDFQHKEIIEYKFYLNVSSKGFASYRYIPSDFNSNCSLDSDKDLFDFFEKIKVLIAAIFISNSADIDESGNIILTYIGHKIIEIKSSFLKIDLYKAGILYDIYEWLYVNGETHEKLSLAREIITRYIQFQNDIWEIPADTLSSIQSAHAIYLKENVEKYIETKNKVAEITTELTVKSRDVSQHIILSFRNNNLTILTYFISIFIFNSLAFNSVQKIFSIEKYYISMVFLVISTVYLLITRKQIYKDIRMNVRYYYSMKRIYKDIFDSKELNSLFHKRQLKYNIDNIKKTMNLFSWLWLIEILLLLLLSIFLTFYI